jgi:cysteinyl-tRNA synthetase, unknown class
MRPILALSLLLVSLLSWSPPCLGKNFNAVHSWGYQLQNADPAQLAACNYDLVVIDYSRDGSDAGAYSAQEIQAIKDSGKTVLAYLSIGEAENYRFYWQPGWRPGNPSWLGPQNPDWPGNYKVRYWDPGWWTAALEPYLNRILDAGFDGVYLDIIDAYWYWAETGKYPLASTADQMVALVEQLGSFTRASRPGFIVCPQNAESIIDDVSAPAVRARYFTAINAIGVEDLYYHFGTLEDQFYRFLKLQQFSQAGKKIFNVEYLASNVWADYLSWICYTAIPIIAYAAMPDRDLDELILNFPKPNCYLPPTQNRHAPLLLLLN